MPKNDFFFHLWSSMRLQGHECKQQQEQQQQRPKATTTKINKKQGNLLSSMRESSHWQGHTGF